MYKISIISIFLILLSNIYAQFPGSYPFETYLDAEENLYVTGELDNNFAMWKYGSLGNILMFKSYSNGGISKGMDIVASNNGAKLYTAGYCYNNNTGNFDIQILKYHDDGRGGVLVWHAEFDNGVSKDDKGYGIAIDGNENVYVCGSVTNSDQTTDYILLKYNSEGVFQWERKYESPGNDVATDIIIDNNFIYIMGYIDEPAVELVAPPKNAMLVTYNINGMNPVTTIVDLPGSSEIPTSFIITEYAHNSIPPVVSKLAVGGLQEKIVGRLWDKNYFIAYFERNTVGDQNIVGWTESWGFFPGDDIGTGITNDNTGNVVITGYFNNDGNDDFASLKYNKTDHSIMWGPITHDILGGEDRASSVSRFGNTYAVSGYSQFSTTNSYITTKFKENNYIITEDWTSSFEPGFTLNNNPEYYTDFATDTYVLSDSSVITVVFGWNSSASAYAIVKYDAGGNEVYNVQPAFDRPGYSSLKSKLKAENTAFELKQNFPNPFNPVTIISYSIPEHSLVTLKVYDILGREVAELMNGPQNAGSYSERFDGSKLASGIYIYKLTAVTGNNRYEKIEKMTLIK